MIVDTDMDRNRRHRAAILRMVRRRLKEGITWQSLGNIFAKAFPYSSGNTLEENCMYLEDKGYLRREFVKDPHAGVERWILYITPSAIDLLDGAIDPDPGVDLLA